MIVFILLVAGASAQDTWFGCDLTCATLAGGCADLQFSIQNLDNTGSNTACVINEQKAGFFKIACNPTATNPDYRTDINVFARINDQFVSGGSASLRLFSATAARNITNVPFCAKNDGTSDCGIPAGQCALVRKTASLNGADMTWTATFCLNTNKCSGVDLAGATPLLIPSLGCMLVVFFGLV